MNFFAVEIKTYCRETKVWGEVKYLVSAESTIAVQTVNRVWKIAQDNGVKCATISGRQLKSAKKIEAARAEDRIEIVL